MKAQEKRELKGRSLISMLLGIAAAATAVAYIVYRVVGGKTLIKGQRHYIDSEL